MTKGLSKVLQYALSDVLNTLVISLLAYLSHTSPLLQQKLSCETVFNAIYVIFENPKYQK